MKTVARQLFFDVLDLEERRNIQNTLTEAIFPRGGDNVDALVKEFSLYVRGLSLSGIVEEYLPDRSETPIRRAIQGIDALPRLQQVEMLSRFIHHGSCTCVRMEHFSYLMCFGEGLSECYL